MMIGLVATLAVVGVTGFAIAARLTLRSGQAARLSVMDRRKDPREFQVSGWDPYIVSLIGGGSSEPALERKVGRSRRAGRVLLVAAALLIGLIAVSTLFAG